MNVNLQSLKRDAAGGFVLVVISILVGLLINPFRTRPLPLVYQSKAERLKAVVETLFDTPLSELTGQQRSLSLEQFGKFVNEGHGVVLDARPEIFYRLGHVPGALSLARDDFEMAYLKCREILEKDQKQSIVVYCSGESCEDSVLLGKALIQLGYENIGIFHGGWTEWTRAGLPEEQGQ
jgi:rhodanese-related sulfurtransferase